MRSQLINRVTSGVVAALLLLTNVLLPAQPAFAEEGDNSGELQQVFCNKEGNSGKWKAQIGGLNTEHESPLKDAQGNDVFVHDQNKVTDSMDKDCQTQYGTVTAAAPSVNPICGADNDEVTLATTAHVRYSQSGWVDGSNTIEATAAEGYSLSGTASWTLTDTATGGCVTEEDSPVVPVAPTVTEITTCGTYGSVVFAETEGITYTLTAGDGMQGAYTVTATANPNYVLAQDATATFSGELGTFTECEEVMACPTNTEWSDVNENEKVDQGECFKKVYVCKYVGTPGIDERLKSGNDGLIQVSVNAIEHNQWDGTIPGYFSDAQDRSYVLGYVGDFETPPTSADCPSPEEPHPTQCTVSDNTFIQPWTYNGDTYPVADAYPSGIPGTATFTSDGIHLITLNQESETYGLIDGGNTPLVDVDAMNYTTFRDVSSTGYAQTLPSYILEVDKDGNPATTTDHTYLFYEPYYNATVVAGTWMTWDAISGGSAKWYMSGTGQALHTWNEFKTTILPGASVVAYGFNQGTYNEGTNAYIKQMTFDCATTTFGAPGKGGGPGPVPTPTPVTPVPVVPGKGSTTSTPVATELAETGTATNGVLAIAVAMLLASIGFAVSPRLGRTDA